MQINSNIFLSLPMYWSFSAEEGYSELSESQFKVSFFRAARGKSLMFGLIFFKIGCDFGLIFAFFILTETIEGLEDDY